jgi:hypothetical protein
LWPSSFRNLDERLTNRRHPVKTEDGPEPLKEEEDHEDELHSEDEEDDGGGGCDVEDGGGSDAVSSGNLQQVRRKARTGNLSLKSSKVIFLCILYTIADRPLGPGSQTHIFESIMTFFGGKKLYNSL